jgi:hypothetical protein
LGERLEIYISSLSLFTSKSLMVIESRAPVRIDFAGAGRMLNTSRIRLVAPPQMRQSTAT